MLRSMWRGLETWLDRNNSIEVGAPVLDPTEDVTLEHWQTVGPGGQARYASAAIQTCLMLGAAFKLPLRQTEGLIASVLTLMGLTISTPDHSTVSRRAVTLPVVQPASLPHGALHVLIDSTGLQVYGAGQWLEAKHGAKSRRKCGIMEQPPPDQQIMRRFQRLAEAIVSRQSPPPVNH
jgi:hypothetical protein